MKELKIMIVEDDLNACKAFEECADTLEDIKLVGACRKADEALRTIQDTLPHAVVLDLELHGGGGSGLDVLKGVREMGSEYKPFFLITTVNSSNTVYDYARKLGADYILYKYQEGYSARYVLDFLRNMKEAIQSSSGQVQTTETPQEKENRIRKRLKAEFMKVGMSPKMKGYDYMVYGVDLFARQPQKNLTAAIAEEFGVTKVSVERAMQNAIDKAWKTADVEDLVANFKAKIHSDKGVPTIMEFVCYYADLIKDEY